MRFVFLLVAAVIAIGAGIAALKLSGGASVQQVAPVVQEKPVEVATTEVLVARTDVSVGSVITQDMVDRQPWPTNLLVDGFVTSDSANADIVGRVARTSFQAGEPFMVNKLASKDDPGFLAAGLPEGKRAVTIATDAISGVAGYIFPGDHVDVLLTHNIPQEIRNSTNADGTYGMFGNSNKPQVNEVLIHNARILAINIRPMVGKEASVNTNPSNVTLEVDPVQAQEIRLAEKFGSLSLVLRSVRDRDEKTIPSPVNPRMLTVSGVIGDGAMVRIVRGVTSSSQAVAAGSANSVTAASQQSSNGMPAVAVPAMPAEPVIDAIQQEAVINP